MGRHTENIESYNARFIVCRFIIYHLSCVGPRIKTIKTCEQKATKV